MASINSKKLLPPSRSSLNAKNKKILIPASNIRVKKNNKISSENLKQDVNSGISSDTLLGIKKAISRIQEILLKSSIFQKKEKDNKKKEQEKNERKRRESKLEKNPSKNNIISGIASSVSNLSFIDRIKKFLFWTLLGRVFSDLLPKLLEFSKRILPVVDFVENFAGNILGGIVDFIDWGYNAYDKVRDLTKQIGGENAQKIFDDFSKHFNTVLNLALIAAMAGSSIGRDSDVPDRRKPGKPGQRLPQRPGANRSSISEYLDRRKSLKQIESKYGYDASRYYESRIQQGRNAKAALGDVRKRFSIKPQTGGLSAANKVQGKLFARGFRKAPARVATKLLGKAGVKLAGKVFGRIPIIGGLVDFLFALWSGEKPGRAAAKAVGATIGSALGTFVPIPLAGTILGGILGDIVGGALYDTLVTNNNKKVQKKAKGGSISRGGRRVGDSPRRSIKVSRVKKPNKIVPQRTIVGKDVGGRKKIDDIYGKGSKKKKRNPVRLLKKISNAVKKNDNILNGLPAAMFGAGIDMTLGQKPDKNLSVDVGNMFGSLIQTSVNSEVSKLFVDVSNILTRAEGGTIPSSRNLKLDNLDIGKKVGNEISQKLISSINSSFTDIYQNLNKEFSIKEAKESGGSGGDGGGDIPGDFSGDVKSTKAYNYFVSQGYKDFQAAAIVGNLLQENRQMNPKLENSIGMKGIAQWDKNRWSNLEKFAERKNLDPYSFETQLQFIEHELKTGDGGLSKSVFQKTKNLEDATVLFRKQYERPGEAEANDKQRIAYAKGVLQSGKKFEYVPPGKVIPVVTGRFGEMRKSGRHGGSDLAVDEGTPLRAISDGKIIESNVDPGGWGNFTVFTDKNGVYHLYGHMRDPGRKPGNIKKGDIIGYVGMTGRTSGPHLHWESGSGWEGVIKNPFDPLKRYSVNAPFNTQRDKPTIKPTDKNKPSEIFEWNKSIKDQGVSFKDGKFVKNVKGLFGVTNQELKVTDTQNTSFRELQGFGLGRGSKEGEKKKAADGKYYEWKGGKWVLWNPAGPGANASLPTTPLNQQVAQLQGKYTDGLMLQNRIIYVEVPA